MPEKVLLIMRIILILNFITHHFKTYQSGYMLYIVITIIITIFVIYITAVVLIRYVYYLVVGFSDYRIFFLLK